MKGERGVKQAKTKRLIPFALAAAACVLVPAIASAGVVVASSGPSASSFPVGKKIGDSEKIVLRAGDALTVLDGKGTRVLRGAGTFSLDQQAGPNKSGTFAVLTERRSAQRMRTGAVRGDEVTGQVQPPNLWYVDLAKPGKVCLAETDRVRIWRNTTDGEASYTLSPAGGGKSETINFGDGDMLTPWDTAGLPVTAGQVYRIADARGNAVGELSFAILNPVAEEPEALAQQLIENGCTRQLELLSSATMVTEG
ncbi:hypothetical protein ASD76_12180 [Altererythrobacter sp. Root672]|nr:hypothetical protein ASD76_12180 [Altererythrobacter sp. Root672]